jgi:hypothetical protein
VLHPGAVIGEVFGAALVVARADRTAQRDLAAGHANLDIGRVDAPVVAEPVRYVLADAFVRARVTPRTATSIILYLIHFSAAGVIIPAPGFDFVLGAVPPAALVVAVLISIPWPVRGTAIPAHRAFIAGSGKPLIVEGAVRARTSKRVVWTVPIAASVGRALLGSPSFARIIARPLSRIAPALAVPAIASIIGGAAAISKTPLAAVAGTILRPIPPAVVFSPAVVRHVSLP